MIKKGETKKIATVSAKGKVARPRKNQRFENTTKLARIMCIPNRFVFKRENVPFKGAMMQTTTARPIMDRISTNSCRAKLLLRTFMATSFKENITIATPANSGPADIIVTLNNMWLLTYNCLWYADGKVQ